MVPTYRRQVKNELASNANRTYHVWYCRQQQRLSLQQYFDTSGAIPHKTPKQKASDEEMKIKIRKLKTNNL